MPNSRLLALIVVAASLVAGCGGDDDPEPPAAETKTMTVREEPAVDPAQAAADVALAFMDAMEARNPGRVCELLTPEAREAVVAVEEGATPCSSLVGPANDDLRLEAPTVRSAEASRSTATVEFNGARQTSTVVELQKVATQWRVKAVRAA